MENRRWKMLVERGHWWSSVLHGHGVEELRQIERREKVKTSGLVTFLLWGVSFLLY